MIKGDMNTKGNNPTAKVGIVSLGCAKNLVNTEQMMYLLKEAYYEVTGDTDADAVVVNTCSFIESAKMEAIDTILELGRAKKSGRIRKIIVAGCLAELYKSEIMVELPEIDAVVGVGCFDKIVSAVDAALTGSGKPALFGDINAPVSETKRILTTSPSWAYLKIAEGCDNNCSYCIIPSIRGRFRSRAMERIIAEATELTERGVKELIIVAQDVTRYGLDLYGKRILPTLLSGLCKIDGLEWIRLHYLYPDDIDDELIEMIAGEKKILKYLDVPIQHVNDGILHKMNRRGGAGKIHSLISRLRRQIPGIVLRTSIITGLPGEGDSEFEELCSFLRDVRIERAGVFPFSPEEGTAAALMGHAGEEIAVRRAELISDIQSRIMDEYNNSRIGSVTTVLVEGRDRGSYYGRSFAESPDVDGYIALKGDGFTENEFIDIRITEIKDYEPVGEKI